MGSLNEEDLNLSVHILKHKSLTTLSHLLNPKRLFTNDDGVHRDWRGLMALCGIGGQFEDSFARDPNPTEKVLIKWMEDRREKASIGTLLEIFEEIDRYDIVEDLTPLIVEDVKLAKLSPQVPNLSGDKDILTRYDPPRRDQHLPLEIFDAFVLFADEDIGYASELIDKMERDYQMKFCTKCDLVAGGLEYNQVIQSITQRCNRLIVILTEAFFNHQTNQYYLNFAQAYGIDNQRKVIPCIYGQCNLPPEMRVLHCLKHNGLNFWSRLHDSLKVARPFFEVDDQSILVRSQSAVECLQRPENTLQASPSVPYLSGNRSVNEIKNGLSELNTCEDAPDAKSLISDTAHHEISVKTQPIHQVKFPTDNELHITNAGTQKKKKWYQRFRKSNAHKKILTPAS